jgi:hypothetical protein
MKKVFLPFLLVISFFVRAQEDSLLSSLESQQPKEKIYATATFKGTRLINNHTVETLGKHNLEFRIGHRFGDVAGGEETFWGLDNANMNITLDYGVSNRLMVGIGRNSFNKLYQGVAKFKITRQAKGGHFFTMDILGQANILSNTKGAAYDDPVNAWSYLTEIIFARKFNKHLSLQFMPQYIHINLVPTNFTNNDIFAMTVSGRYKFTRSVAVTAEYSHALNNYYDKNNVDNVQYIPVFSAGFDLETGGHVFQLFLTNATTLNEVQVIPMTTADWGRNQYRFGFNISRIFAFGQKSKAALKEAKKPNY